MNLRQRIRPGKINCTPWKIYRGEIKQLCISGQCLFSKDGLNLDVLEIELKDESWLTENENIWDVILTEDGLKRQLNYDDTSDDPFDESWTEEDYIHFYNNI